MSTREEFIVAVFSASNAIILLMSILTGTKLPEDKFRDGRKALKGIVTDLNATIKDSEFSDTYVKDHGERLAALAEILTR